MEPNIETNSNNTEQDEKKKDHTADKFSIPMAIVVAGALIAGAILLQGNIGTNENPSKKLAPVPKITEEDNMLGNKEAEISVVIYEDFQCPFCEAMSGIQTDSQAAIYLKQQDPSWTPFLPGLKQEYVDTGKISLVYRDWPFLGPESVLSAHASMCAKEQDKFFEYHDYLYARQNGENEGTFIDTNLKSFAKNLGLDSAKFDECLDSGKYVQSIEETKQNGTKAGVDSTPKGFILKDGKLIDTINGAESYSTVKQKIEAVLK